MGFARALSLLLCVSVALAARPSRASRHLLDVDDGIAGSCDAVAARLNKAFMADSSTFDGDGSALDDWLVDHGVLLSMCDAGELTQANATTGVPANVTTGAPEAMRCNAPMDHVSASWVSGKWETYPSLVGKVFDPLSVEVRCLYPTDASTDFREDAGCGARKNDPDFGSEGAANATAEDIASARKRYDDFLASIGYPNGTWADVKCSQVPTKYFDLDPWTNFTIWMPPDPASLASCEAMTSSPASAFRSGAEARVQSAWSQVNEWVGAILGHPMCVDDGPPCSDPTGVCSATTLNAWEYHGACSWQPSQFTAAKDAQAALRQRGEANNVAMWNEIVLSNAANDGSAALAVFWVDYPEAFAEMPGITGDVASVESPEGSREFMRAAAKAYAEVLGKDWVLVVDPSEEAAAAGSTFKCDNQ